jgi:hypothetical protein
LKTDLNAAEYVAHVFGGVRPLAAVLGLHFSTVSHWINGQGPDRVGKGMVPARYQQMVMAKAKVMKIKLEAKHLIYGGEVEAELMPKTR